MNIPGSRAGCVELNLHSPQQIFACVSWALAATTWTCSKSNVFFKCLAGIGGDCVLVCAVGTSRQPLPEFRMC